ncbi:MAG: cytochrome c biogenesis protein ResB [Prochlorococcaceae cyanobacterium]
MSPSLAPARSALLRGLALLSDLRLAIVLLLAIAVASTIGTAIPQGEDAGFYLERYNDHPWLGMLRGPAVLALGLDHLYTSPWFLVLLAWLSLALLLCSLRRQWPALQAGLRWIDYRQPRQLSKLAIALSRDSADGLAALDRLESLLRQRGWAVRRHDGRLAARRGVLGRVGPLLVHAGMVVFIAGAVVGAFGGQRLERFLAPGHSLELISPRGGPGLELALEAFSIDRDPQGRPEQYTSELLLRDLPGDTGQAARVSVNHPLRHRGITVYQADWGLARVGLQLGRSPVLPLPLQTLPQLGEQVWGLVLPTRPDGSLPVLLTLRSELGPAEVFGANGQRLGLLTVGGDPVEVEGLPLRLTEVLPASGLLIKRDPGVPLVYGGFAVLLAGGVLSLIATRQLWAIADGDRLHVGGLCNRDLTGFADGLPQLVDEAVSSRAADRA